jgi:hypothetical protein
MTLKRFMLGITLGILFVLIVEIIENVKVVII